jgi:hypothetical protein
MLFKDSAKSASRNLSSFEIKPEDVLYGEDFFLIEEREEILSTSYEDDAHVTLVGEKELKALGKDIHVYHTSEFCKSYLDQLLPWAQEWLPNAKWVSSCVNPADAPSKKHPGNFDPKNVCISIPSPCEGMFLGTDKNQFHLFRNKFELDLLGIKKEIKRNKKNFSSFMHNFHVRDPHYYQVFESLKRELKKVDIDLTNYGGNVRSVGADIRFSRGRLSGKGPSGSNFETLSPRKAIEKYLESNSVVHLKGLDWAGGVPAHAQMTGTPFVTHSGFLISSNYEKYYNINTGTVSCNSFEDLCFSILELSSNDNLHLTFSKSMAELGNTFFTKEYWNNWHTFVESIT